jgi:hypothetical protein
MCTVFISRQKYITELGQAFCIGDTGANLVALSYNQDVKLHDDHKDGTLIGWMGGDATQ